MKRTPVLIMSILMASALMASACATSSSTGTPQPSQTTSTASTDLQPEIHPPEIKDILGPDEAAVSENTSFVCWAIDPDNRNLTYEWSVSSGSVSGTDRNGTWWTPEKPGTYTITCKVTNDAGLETVKSKDFVISALPETHKFEDKTIYLKLNLPSNDLVTVSTTCAVNTILEIQCNVAGSEADLLTYQWNAPIGKISGNGLAEGKADRLGWIAPGTPGQYKIAVTVSDKLDRSARGEVTINVMAQ